MIRDELLLGFLYLKCLKYIRKLKRMSFPEMMEIRRKQKEIHMETTKNTTELKSLNIDFLIKDYIVNQIINRKGLLKVLEEIRKERKKKELGL